MNVSSAKLIDFVRCARFAALDKSFDSTIDIEDEIHNTLFFHRPESEIGFIDEEEGGFLDECWGTDIHSDYRESFLKLVEQALVKHLGRPSASNKRFTYPFRKDIILHQTIDFVYESEEELIAITASLVSDRHLRNLDYRLGRNKVTIFAQNGWYYHVSNEVRDALTQQGHHKLQRVFSHHEMTGRMLYDQVFTQRVLTGNVPKKTRIILALVHSDYVRSQDDEMDIVTFIDVTDLAQLWVGRIETDLYRMINHIELDDSSRVMLVKNACMRGTRFACKYAEYCFSHIPKRNSLFAYFQHHLGFREGPGKARLHDIYELLDEGIVDMMDMPISWLQREKNLMQRYCVENDYFFVNKKKIRAKLSTLVYPVHYLDMEALPAPLPRFVGERPYTPSVFMFSVHTQHEPYGRLRHVDALITSNDDHRKDIIEQLLEAIPEGDGSVVVFYQDDIIERMDEWIRLFPEYASRLDLIKARLFDLLLVVKNDYAFYQALGYTKAEASTYNLYHPDQNGSYDLKAILSAFKKDPFADLEIKDRETCYREYARSLTSKAKDKAIIFPRLRSYAQYVTVSYADILDGLWAVLEK